jgi:hypothetical protein
VQDDFAHKSNNGYHAYDYGDVDSGHGLGASISPNGTLGFEISALGDSGRLGSGTDMFASLMNRLDADGVSVTQLRGQWYPGPNSTNFSQYMANVKAGMSPTVAAANTWTGRIAAQYGYTRVIPNGNPSKSGVSFTFARPE